MEKNFFLKSDQIKKLISGTGSCFATDRIMVEGKKIGFMYRQKPDNVTDSGWRFFSGINEDDEYTNNTRNLGIYDLNTVTNYDESIIPFLESAVGSVYERIDEGVWQTVNDWDMPNY
jgi:hypothetical protein